MAVESEGELSPTSFAAIIRNSYVVPGLRLESTVKLKLLNSTCVEIVEKTEPDPPFH
jgi:hypothetical protein